MAASSLTLVNQKLAYCRALMKLVQSESVPKRADDRLRRQALLDAGAFHLLCAYRHYLRELAEHHTVADTSRILTEQDLLQALDRLGKTSFEARELQALSEDAQSWLSGLHNAYHSFWQPPVAESLQRIEVVDLDSPAGAARQVSRENLEAWYRAFNDLVERQRETSAEY
ncbi:DUF6586 family protein [Marinimicrobium agarilyticum]|uniref:DUF6586 family protein n=1 Tax=Marinimicrobium agarilyticum TaxID=306546 RepID=UPI00040E0B10|nr:DUF6586 family protein [Marinimicrobium agarilyticum]